jgi:APA family basic amino acid/polyamine antiporter
MAIDSARFGGMFAVKSADAHLEHVQREGRLRRAIGLVDLTALGLGAIIGTGIFVILGEAIGDSGPAIVLSFALAAVTCAFSALSYWAWRSTSCTGAGTRGCSTARPSSPRRAEPPAVP